MNILATAAAVVVSIGTIGGSYAWLDSSYTRKTDFIALATQMHTGTVMELRKEIKGTPPGPWKEKLCETLTLELNSICADAPNHPFCMDRRAILEDAGCQ